MVKERMGIDSRFLPAVCGEEEVDCVVVHFDRAL